MASYEESGDQVVDNINSSPDLKPETKSAIARAVEANKDANGNVVITNVDTPEDLENLEPGTTMAIVDTGVDVSGWDDSGVPVVVFTGSGDVDINLTSPGERTVTLGEGDDSLTIGGAQALGNAELTALVGDDIDAVIEGAGGNDSIVSAGGTDSIDGGAGNDSISSGAGGDSILAGTGNDSVDGGSGFDQVMMANGGGASNYSFEVIDGEVVVTDVSGEITTVSNAEYIDLGDGAAIINAADTEDGTAARQSEAILGRQMTAEELEDYNLTVNEIGLDEASSQLMVDSGFAAETADLTDAEYINLLYNRTFGRDVDPEGADFYAQQLADGSIDRGKLAADLGWSDEGIESNDMVNEIDGLV